MQQQKAVWVYFETRMGCVCTHIQVHTKYIMLCPRNCKCYWYRSPKWELSWEWRWL